MLRCAILGAQGLYALYRKAELALLALSTSQYFVYLPLSIQRLQARSKYIHVCSAAPSLAHKACTRYTEKPNLRCWLPSPCIPQPFVYLPLSIQRSQARSKYIHVCSGAPSWRTRPVRVIPKSRTCASGSQLPAPCIPQPFVYLPLSIQRSQARSKYIHVCSGAPSLAHKACTHYTERRTCAAGSQLPALGSRLSALGSRLPAPSPQFSKQ